MTAARLLRLYPRRWRDRYGDELLDIAGDRPLTLQQAIDIISGAIDAWLSADVRRAATSGGNVKTSPTWMCQGTTARYTKRDGLIGAAVMIASSLVLVVIATALEQLGLATMAESLLSLGFLVALTLSMPFWLMKGQPWKAQAVITGGTVLFLLVVVIVSSL